MTYEERLKEAERLKQENQAVLSTPLMSEGNISPMQVGMFSTRQKARWQADAMRKMATEYDIKQLRRTDDEMASDEKRKQAIIEDERQSTIKILQSKIDFIYGLGNMSHNKYGKLRPSYQRTVGEYQKELELLLSQNVRSRC